MLISNPILPPKFKHVEIDIGGRRMYKNTDNGNIVYPNDMHSPTSLTHEEINRMVVNKIRERYDINEEFKMINLGIIDSENPDYIEYREYVKTCVSWGDELELDGGDLNER